MADLVVIFIGACLVNNLILDALLAAPVAVAISRKIEIAIGMAMTMIIVLTVSTLVSHLLYYSLLAPYGFEYLQTLGFIVMITLMIMLTDKGIQAFKPVLHERIAPFIPLTLVNSAVLGVALLNIQHPFGIAGSLVFGLGAGTGYGLIMIMLAAIQERVIVADIPKPFRGMAITLITLGIMSMAFMGFIGIVNY